LPIDSLTAQKRMAEAGFGLAILPESSLEEELRTGTLHAIDAPALTVTIPVALIRRRNAFQTGGSTSPHRSTDRLAASARRRCRAEGAVQRGRPA
jgi:DNA-binding transcriptional LysR family regulator